MKSWIPFGFTALVISVALLLSPKIPLKDRYRSLLQWDSQHYLSITREGYHLPKKVVREDVHTSRANLGFFPAYPLLTQVFVKGTGLDPDFSLLVISQLFSVLFWFFYCKLLVFWKFPLFESCLTLLLYPASFFLVMGYSESLFVSSLVALILFTERWLKKTSGHSLSKDYFLASLCGFTLSGSRLIGFSGILYPIIRAHRSKWSYVLGFLSSLGGLGYFAFCQYSFGSFKLYFDLQQLGWGNQPDFLAVIKPSSYFPLFFFEDTRQSLCKLSNFGMAWLFFQNLKKPWNLSGLALTGCAFIGFFVSVSGKSSYGMDSLIRYNLPIFLLLVLATLVNQRPFFFRSIQLKLVLVVLQLWMLRLFVSGRWVA